MVLFVDWHLDIHWQSELAQPERVVESDLHIYSNSHHFLTGNYYSISSLLACVYMSELLGMGTGGSKCVMSTEFNGELLQVFSKSFVFAQLLFVDHSQRTAELLRPVTRAGPDTVELVNCTLIQTSRWILSSSEWNSEKNSDSLSQVSSQDYCQPSPPLWVIAFSGFKWIFFGVFPARSQWVYKVYNSVLCNIAPGLRQTPGMK